MKNISIDDFSEQTCFTFSCPNCGQYNDIYDSPDIGQLVTCRKCISEFKIIEQETE